MNVTNYLSAIILCVSLLACSKPEQLEDRPKFESLIDEFCSWAGMIRSGSIRDIQRWPTENPGYNVAVHLNVDGSTRPYLIRFDSRQRLLSVTPESMNLGDIRIGANTLQDPEPRSLCIAAVSKLKPHLGRTWYGPPAIQRVGSDFIVTYVTVSPSEQKKNVYNDPYISFLITSKCTVFAVFFGA